MADVELRAGDLYPPLDVTLVDSDGSPADTIGATSVTIRLLTADRTEVWSHPGVVDNATPGRVTYDWIAGDTDNTAFGLGLEFVLLYGSRPRTLPSTGPMSVAFRVPLAPRQLPLQPEDVAAATGISLPLSDAKRAQLADVIRRVAGEMEAFLGYSPAASTYTELVLDPAQTGRPYVVDFPPVIQVISRVAQPGGQILLTYRGGYDVEVTEALRSYLVEHAAVRFRNSLAEGDPDRTVSSLSVEGQSVTYGAAAAGEVGAPPTLDSITRYKRRGMGGRTFTRDPFADVPTGVTLDRPLDTYNLPPGWIPVQNI